MAQLKTLSTVHRLHPFLRACSLSGTKSYRCDAVRTVSSLVRVHNCSWIHPMSVFMEIQFNICTDIYIPIYTYT